MEPINTDALFNEGVSAARSGDIAQAALLFSRYVREHPASASGWLWLGQCCTEPEQKKYCFQRVLNIDPQHKEALIGLAALGSGAPAGSEIVRPFVAMPGDPLDPDAFGPGTPAAFSPSSQVALPGELSSAFLEEPDFSSPVRKIATPSAKKKSSLLKGLVSFLAFIFLLLIGSILFLYFTGALRFNSLSNLSPSQPVVYPAATSLTATGTISQPFTTPTIAASPTVIATLAYEPAYEEAPCKFEKPAGVQVNCGFIILPENRTRANSPQIKLAVALFHSLAAQPSPDPVIFLQGGPGGEAVMTSVAMFDLLVEPFLKDHDFIAFDQRGTGLSFPSVDCAELETANKQDIFQQIPLSGRTLVFNNAFRSCHGMMVVSGIDPNDFTTDASSDDLNDLVTALGYQQVDLYAASYGTRLALATMRKHPQVLRSVVLDSVVPLEADLFYDDPARYNSSLQALFDACSLSSQCAARYPNLEADFWDLVSKLNANPVSVTAPLLTGGHITEVVTGKDLIETLTLGLLKKASLIASAPLALDQISAGDYSTFIAMQTSLPDGFKDLNLGVYTSMLCHEHILARSPAELQQVLDSQQETGVPYDQLFFGDAEDIFNTCKVWGAVPPTSQEKDPLISDIPTLILEGAFDPSTPPYYGKMVAQNLSHSYYMEFPNQGHIPLTGDNTGCASSMIISFIDDPAHSPDSACLANLPPVDFLVPYDGSVPVKLVLSPGQNLKAKMPLEWEKYFDGFYLRNNSPLDITQVVIVRTYFIDAATLLHGFSSKLYGYEGFDAAPLMVGVRQANGMEWSLYETSSYDRPVDLAVADSPEGDAFVVVLFSHKDEHEALFDTVFLPIIDSLISAP